MVSSLFVINVSVFLLTYTRTTESLECYKCSNLTDINQCNDIIQCSSDQSCFHDSYSFGQTQIYSLGCIDKHQCSTNSDTSKTIGVVERALQRRTNLCHECCSTDRCNKPLCEHFNPSSCIDDHKIDCAYLNTVTKVCSDIQHARTICPRFCDLCDLPSFTTSFAKSTTTTKTEPTTLNSSTSQPTGTTEQTRTATAKMSAFKACEQLARQSNTAFAKDNFCYELVTHHETFVNAERDCMRKGGHLAHIQSMEEQKFLTTNIHHFVSDSYIWIGLQDSRHEEHFEWTSGERLTFTHWYPFRKDLFLHGLEDCVAMRTYSLIKSVVGEWNDLPCSRAHAYICQFGGPVIIG